MKTIEKRISVYAPSIVRIGMSLVVLWFGTQQLRHPEFFIGYLPMETEALPISQTLLVLFNGGFEIAFGLLMLLGVFTRIAAFLLAVHLAGITFTLGMTQVGVRDFGLTLATLSVCFAMPDKLTIENWLKRRDEIPSPTE